MESRLPQLISNFHAADSADSDITGILIDLAELLEQETEAYLKQDPDPLSERLPEDCCLKQIIDDNYEDGICDVILACTCSKSDSVELNTAKCRFILSMFSGINRCNYSKFSTEDFVLQLFNWAENAAIPLRTSASGVLAEVKHESDYKFYRYKEKHIHLVPLMIRRLSELRKQLLYSTNCDEEAFNYFGNYEKEDELGNSDLADTYRAKMPGKRYTTPHYSPIFSMTKSREKTKLISKISSIVEEQTNENSDSKFAEFMIMSYQTFPLTSAIEELYILKYLTSIGEYKVFIERALKENVLALVLRYLDLRQNRDIKLSFEALKYLSSLLRHKAIAKEFLIMGGLDILLKVQRPSLAAVGVSICLCSLVKLEEIMEAICFGPSSTIYNLVNYALWLLECSHKSSRKYAATFFGFGFSFKSILQQFDNQDGLRKLFNAISTLDIFVAENETNERLRYRTTVKHVFKSFKRYFEAHLAILVEEKRADKVRFKIQASMMEQLTQDAVESNINTLHDLSVTPLVRWKPVNEFTNLGGINLLLELVSSYFTGSSISFRERVKTIRNALDVLNICSLTISTKLKLCGKIASLKDSNLTGIKILLQAAEGQLEPLSGVQLMPVTEVQRSALLIITNVCSKITSVKSSSQIDCIISRKIDRKIQKALNKIWKSIIIENGIPVLIKLLSIKSFPSDPYSIRVLACKALCGLTQSETLKQILGKLPLIANGQIFDLMREPVSFDKYSEHVQFCKYSIELVKRVCSNPKLYEYCPSRHSFFKTSDLSYSPFGALVERKPNRFQRGRENCLLSVQKRETSIRDNFRDAAVNLKHVYSRFRLRRLNDKGRSVDATCVCFDNNSESDPKLIMGTRCGEFTVNFFDTSAGQITLDSEDWNDKEILSIESGKSTSLLITSDTSSRSRIWNLISTSVSLIHSFSRACHMEFGKCRQDRVTCTKPKASVIYDVNTFSEIGKFRVNKFGNRYERNAATFDSSDELVLSDGLLYDVRSGQLLHKFAKLDSNMNGVFHPNGREIISSSYVWDIRTFKLLQTVTGLDQCRVTFNKLGTIIYAVKEAENADCFFTFDALDYKMISTVGVGRSVRQVSCDLTDRYIAVIVGSLEWHDGFCRLYEVGVTKQAGDDSEEDSEYETELSSLEETDEDTSSEDDE